MTKCENGQSTDPRRSRSFRHEFCAAKLTCPINSDLPVSYDRIRHRKIRQELPHTPPIVFMPIGDRPRGGGTAGGM